MSSNLWIKITVSTGDTSGGRNAAPLCSLRGTLSWKVESKVKMRKGHIYYCTRGASQRRTASRRTPASRTHRGLPAVFPLSGGSSWSHILGLKCKVSLLGRVSGLFLPAGRAHLMVTFTPPCGLFLSVLLFFILATLDGGSLQDRVTYIRDCQTL